MKNKYLIQWLNHTKEWDNEAEVYVRKNNSKIVFLDDVELLEFCRESDKVDIKVTLLKEDPVPSLDNQIFIDLESIFGSEILTGDISACKRITIPTNKGKLIVQVGDSDDHYQVCLQNGVETNKEQPKIKKLIWDFAKDIWESEYGRNVGEVDSPEKTNMLEFFKDYCKQNNLG